jgi:hypothetical protein
LYRWKRCRLEGIERVCEKDEIENRPKRLEIKLKVEGKYVLGNDQNLRKIDMEFIWKWGSMECPNLWLLHNGGELQNHTLILIGQ